MTTEIIYSEMIYQIISVDVKLNVVAMTSTPELVTNVRFFFFADVCFNKEINHLFAAESTNTITKYSLPAGGF